MLYAIDPLGFLNRRGALSSDGRKPDAVRDEIAAL